MNFNLASKIGAALGTIATIWNIVGSILLAVSTAVFHSVEIRTSFLPAFHSAIYFNIIFAAILLAAAILVHSRIKKIKEI